MKKHQELLDIIDRDEKVIDQATRERVHCEGLYHREITVWLITEDHKLIFGKRSATKDTNLNLLSAAVAGHVDLGMIPDSAALMELEEEVGIIAQIEDLKFIKKISSCVDDPQTNNTNNVLRYHYLFKKKVVVSDLKLEEGEADGFYEFTLEQLENLSDQDKKRFTQSRLAPESMQLYREILKK